MFKFQFELYATTTLDMHFRVYFVMASIKNLVDFIAGITRGVNKLTAGQRMSVPFQYVKSVVTVVHYFHSMVLSTHALSLFLIKTFHKIMEM